MQIIIFLLSNLLGTLLYLLLICCFLSFKLTPKQKLGLFFLLFINILLMNLYLGHIGVVFLLLSCCLYISILHKNRLLNICLFIGSYLFGVVCDNIFSLIWNAFIIPIPKLMSSDYYYILYLLSFDLLMAVICPFAARLVHRFISKIHAKLPKQSLLLIVGNLLICLFIFLFNITLGESIGYTQKIITFNCILFGCYFLISTMLIIKIIQSQMDMLAMDMRQETVSSKGINRGIGLYNAQEILSKYKHVFWDTETSETHFTQRLRILRK